MELRQTDVRQGTLTLKNGGTVRMDECAARAESAAAQAAESAAAAAARLEQAGLYAEAIEALRRDVDSIGEELPEKYTKPFEGIPDTDLSADVQASLGRADTALQPDALSAYRTAAAQDVIDAGKQAALVSGENIKTVNGQTILGTGDLALPYSRPNLLDNWYFVGGGSQQGNGVFPINQKGQTTYTASGITIDRWKSGEKVNVSTSYTEFVNTSTSARAFYSQKLTTAAATIASQKCTISILTSDGSLYSATGTVGAAGSGTRGPNVDFNGNSFFLTQDGSGAAVTLAVTTGSVKLRAVKFEIGDYQTLAHKEGSTWVLNGIPDYKNELEKCQRYLRIANWNSAHYLCGLGWVSNTTTINAFFPFANMAKSPTITPTTGNLWRVIGTDGTQVTPTSVALWYTSDSGIGLKFTVPAVAFRGACVVTQNSGTSVYFSAE